MDKTTFLPYWKALANEKTVMSFDVFNYCIFKAISSKSNDKQQLALNLLEKAFSPITNKVKLANGRKAFDKIYQLAWTGRHWINKIIQGGMPTYCHGWATLLTDPADKQLYYDIVDWVLNNWSRAGRHYVYIFVRQDILSPEQIAVQAAHATLVLGTGLDKKFNPRKLYFTLVGVNSHSELIKAVETMHVMGIKGASFTEPDLGNIVTAVASYPIHHAERGALLEYPLLTIAPVAQPAE